MGFIGEAQPPEGGQGTCAAGRGCGTDCKEVGSMNMFPYHIKLHTYELLCLPVYRI